MTDYADLKRRLGEDVRAHEITHNGKMKRVEAVREAIAAIAALEADVARLKSKSNKSTYHTGFADGLRKGMAAAALCTTNPADVAQENPCKPTLQG